LHTIANAYRKASEEFSEISGFVDDVFGFFRRSLKRSQQYRKLQRHLGMKEHKIQRHVELRWLNLLPCLLRIEEQWVALSYFMLKGDGYDSSDRSKRLCAALRNPETRHAIRFLIYALKMAQPFENMFQQSRVVLIHRLKPQLMNLVSNIGVQFLKPSECETSSILKTDIKATKNNLPIKNIRIGPSVDGVSDVFRYRCKNFYIKLLDYLRENLPLKKKILRCLSFLDTTTAIDEDSVMYVSKKLPNVVSADNADNLRSEIRLFNIWKDKPSSHEWKNKVTEAWALIAIAEEDGEPKFPHLSALAKACSTLFHGNADCERDIGKSHDIDDNEKRNRMDDKTRKNLLFCRSYLRSRRISSGSNRMEIEMIERGFKAHSEYTTHMAKERKQIEIENMKRLAAQEADEVRKALVDDAQRKNELKELSKEFTTAKKKKKRLMLSNRLLKRNCKLP
jgi:hypothetical protein